MKKKQRISDVKFGIASGPWKTIESSEGAGAYGSSGSDGAFTFSKPNNTEDGANITVTHEKKSNKESYRIVAVDLNDKVLTSSRTTGTSVGQWTQTTVYYQNLNLDQIKEFRFQTRPYEWITFKNVSLQPGHKTDVKINVEGEQATETVKEEEQQPAEETPTKETIPSPYYTPSNQLDTTIFQQKLQELQIEKIELESELDEYLNVRLMKKIHPTVKYIQEKIRIVQGQIDKILLRLKLQELQVEKMELESKLYEMLNIRRMKKIHPTVKCFQEKMKQLERQIEKIEKQKTDVQVEGENDLKKGLIATRKNEFVQQDILSGIITDKQQLSKGCSVHVRALDEEGNPIKNVRLYAALMKGYFWRDTTEAMSDKNGNAILGGIKASEVPYMITAWHPDYAMAGQTVDLSTSEQIESIVFNLDKGVVVKGNAICSDGYPADGWEINALPKWWNSVHLGRPQTIDKNGEFSIPHIVPGINKISINIPHGDGGGSMRLWSTELTLPPEKEFLELNIPHPSPKNRVSISGTIKFIGGESGRDIWLHARSESGDRGNVYVSKGQQKFTLTNLVPGIYSIDCDVMAGDAEMRIFRNFKAPSEGNILELKIKQKETRKDIKVDADKNALIERGKTGMIKGRIIDESGKGITGTNISFRYKRTRYEKPEDKHITVTGDEGEFTIEGIPDSSIWQWFVFRNNNYAPVIKMIPVENGAAKEVEIILKKGGTVEGYVYDDQGKPIPNATLYFMDESHYGYWEENRGRLSSATTDSNGYYYISHLPEKRCYVFRHDPDKQLGVVQTAFIPQNRKTIRVDIGGPWRATGRIFKDDSPYANTRLYICGNRLFAPAFKAYAQSDSQGRFAFCGIPTGTYYLSVNMTSKRRDWWAEIGKVAFGSHKSISLGDFEINLTRVVVRVTTDDSTEKAQHWDVYIQKYDDMYWYGRKVEQLIPREELTDPYVFTGLPLGKYEVIARRQDYPSFRQVFELKRSKTENQINLRIPIGTFSLSGKIDGDTRPLILRSIDQTITMFIKPNPSGRYELSNLPEGKYIVGRASVAQQRQSSLMEIQLGSNEKKAVNINVASVQEEARGYLVVVVVTGERAILPGTKVWLQRGENIIQPHYDTDDGKSFMGDVGEYILHAEYPGYKPVHQSVRMKEREECNAQELKEPIVVHMVKM